MTSISPDAVYDWLAYHARFHPDDLAAVDLATGRQLSYAAFNERASRLATGLARRFGIAKGDRVALVAHNSTDHFELLFACWKLGAIFMPLNWRLAAPEIAELLDHGDPQVVLCDAEFAHLLPAGRASVLRAPDAPADCGYEALIRDHAPEARMPRLTYDDVHTLLYTSGTTGRPKGVVYNFRMTMNIVMAACTHVDINRTSRTLIYSPLFHTAGLHGGSLSLFHFGATVYVMRRWDAAQGLRYLTDPDFGITHSFGVPTHYAMMSELPAFADASFPTLRYLGIGSAPVPMSLLTTWECKGVALGQSFGMTEAFSVALTPPYKAKRMLGSAGHQLLHCELQIGDDHGRELPRGTVGEVQIRGPGVTPGYWRDPELTAAAFVDGWFRSGDAGRMDPDGTLYIVDRFKDMYISGGENIYPAEVESVIAGLPAVSQVAVIGIPDPRWAEVGMALIRLKPGATLSEDRVIERCRERLARYKVPKVIRFVSELPVSPQGKILKRELRRQFAVG